MNDDRAPVKLHRIFVYGSLRRGEDNHKIWFGRGATPVADGYIQGAELVNLGAYCCIVPVDDLTRRVVGEVYDLAKGERWPESYGVKRFSPLMFWVAFADNFERLV